jgi:hypothetical protein
MLQPLSAKFLASFLVSASLMVSSAHKKSVQNQSTLSNFIRGVVDLEFFTTHFVYGFYQTVAFLAAQPLQRCVCAE